MMNFTFKKGILVCLLIVLMLPLVSGCSKQGNVENVQIEEFESEIFTVEEINETIKVLKEDFKKNFKNNELLTIHYPGDAYIKKKITEYEKSRYHTDKIIVYEISFKVGKNSPYWPEGSIQEGKHIKIGYKDNKWVVL